MTRPVGTSVAEKLIGRTMDGKYRIDAFVGRGAMGLVFRATQLDVDKCVALKIMRSDVMADETALQRFYREARATSKLNHPNTIKVFESGQFSEGYPFIAMEFLDGEPLHKVIADEGALSAQRIVKIVLQVAKALAEAHNENIVHRDLKPGNIMILQLYGEHDFVKVLDFGIAKILTDTTSQQLTQAGFALGTPHYMSPEQAKGKPLDARSDLYSLGVIMFEMLTGRVPFKGDSSVDVIMKHISSPVPRVHVDATRYPYTARLLTIVERMLEKDREKRVQSSLDLIKALEPLNLEGERMTMEGRIERVPREDLLREGGSSASDSTGAEADEPAIKTMALNADDLQGLGLDLPSRPAAQPSPNAAPAPAPAPVQPTPMLAPVYDPEGGGAEKTMALSAADVLGLVPPAPAAKPTPAPAPAPVPAAPPVVEAPEAAEATMLFDAISAALPPLAAPAPKPAPAPALESADGEAAERTMLFDQLDASLQQPAPAPAPRPAAKAAPATSPIPRPAVRSAPSSVAARRPTAPAIEAGHEDATMMFDAQQPASEAISQDGATMMFDADAYLKLQPQAPLADQDSSTVMLDAASLGLGGPGVNQDGSTMMVDAASVNEMLAQASGRPSSPPAQKPVARPSVSREEGTLMIDQAADVGLDTASRRGVGTSPGVRTSPGTTTNTGVGQRGGLSSWLVWSLIGVGSVAIAVAVYFILQG